MSDFDLDLRAVEEQLDEEEAAGGDDADRRILLDVLDGSTDDEEWVSLVEAGNVLVLAVEGDVNRLAAGFARPVRDMGGSIVHFRGFLLVAPPSVDVDDDRLA